MKAFEVELGGLNGRHYVLTDVHGNDIVKNFNFASKKSTLS